jgi:hypothetical protein
LKVIRGQLAQLFDFDTRPVAGPYVESDSPTVLAGPHDYFDMLSARADCMVAYSLRDPAQLVEYARARYQPLDVTYDPLNDPDPRRQDAAKIVVPAGKASLPNQVRLPIPSVGSDSLLVTWDVWWGKEFAADYTGISHYKAFQLASPANLIWTELQSDFNRALKFKPAVAMTEVRAYGEQSQGELGPNVTNDNPLSPMLNQFPIMPEKWTRYWVFINPNGEWHEFSYWMADEDRGPVLINDRLQMKPNPNADGWEKLWIEFNTSDHPWDGVGARVAYIRNVAMLRGAPYPSALLERPVR